MQVPKNEVCVRVSKNAQTCECPQTLDSNNSLHHTVKVMCTATSQFPVAGVPVCVVSIIPV
jgi:hypothetical protein